MDSFSFALVCYSGLAAGMLISALLMRLYCKAKKTKACKPSEHRFLHSHRDPVNSVCGIYNCEKYGLEVNTLDILLSLNWPYAGSLMLAHPRDVRIVGGTLVSTEACHDNEKYPCTIRCNHCNKDAYYNPPVTTTAAGEIECVHCGKQIIYYWPGGGNAYTGPFAPDVLKHLIEPMH